MDRGAWQAKIHGVTKKLVVQDLATEQQAQETGQSYT